MAGGKVSQKVEVEGLKETLRAFSKYGKDANAELHKPKVRSPPAPAAAAQGRASGLGGVHSLAARSLRARSDRTPTIVGGGRKAPYFFGAEFGGGGRPRTRQFPPHRGQAGYFLWPTIKARQHADHAEWMRAVDRVSDKWARGG
jgi:hypothetical protein